MNKEVRVLERYVDFLFIVIGRKAKYEFGCWEEWMWGGSL